MGHLVKEIFEKRDLIRELVLKDMRIRYAKPALGFFWSFFSPFFTVAIFYVVFSFLLRVEIKEAPFFLYLMSAVFSWKFFSDSLSCSLTSLIDNKNLIRESGVPQYFIPLSIVLSNAINYLPSLCILIITSLVVLKGLPVFILFLPLVLVIHLLLTIGASFICSILYVRWRETKYILEVLLQAFFYLTPAFYSLFLVKGFFSDALFIAYTYNPFVGVLNLYRITVLRGFFPAVKELIDLVSLVVIPLLCASCLLFLGSYLFKRNKNSLNERLSC
jgi:lipopolysaccharide transport system permease protein